MDTTKQNTLLQNLANDLGRLTDLMESSEGSERAIYARDYKTTLKAYLREKAKGDNKNGSN